jgi:hypothetical protein
MTCCENTRYTSILHGETPAAGIFASDNTLCRCFFALQEDSFRRQMLRMNAFDGKVKREKEKMGRYGEKG